MSVFFLKVIASVLGVNCELLFLAAVGLRGLRHDGGRGVAVLHIAGTRTHHPCRRAALQSERCAQRGQGGYQYRDDDFDDLLSGHSCLCFFSALSFGISLFEPLELRIGRQTLLGFIILSFRKTVQK